MKIVCDSCSTKYSISDDKVRGKVFKIRCKKCSHIIVVRGTGDGAAAAAPEAPSEAVWHIVIEGEQAGPLTDAEVRGKLSRAEISGENYIWREGFADWLKLGAVPEFADAIPQPPASGELFSNGTPATDGGAEADAGFFGGGMAGQEARAMAGGGSSGPAATASTSSRSGRNRATATSMAAAAAAPAAEEDAFSAPAGAGLGSGGADLFGAAANVPAAADSGRTRGSNGTASGRHDGGRIENLTAQRSENSVLFSLSNLQSLASPSAASAAAKQGAAPTAPQSSEGSGLIDIRAMAASTLRAPAPSAGPIPSGFDSSSRDDDLPSFGTFSSAAPVLLPLSSSSGTSKWIFIGIGIVAVLAAALLAIAFSILRKPVVAEQPPVPVAPPAAVATPGAPAGAVARAPEAPKAPETPTSRPMPEGDLPPREGGPAAGAAAEGGDKADKSDKGDKGRKHKGGGKKGDKGAEKGGGDKGGGETVAAGGAEKGTTKATPAPATPDEPEDELTRLLNKATGGKKAGGSGAKAAGGGEKSGGGSEPAASGPLPKAAVVAGMNSIRPKVSECYAQFKVPGSVNAKLVIGKDGKVSSVTITGKFAGTPSGACVEKAVRSAKFPPSEGLTLDYPFNLR